MSAPWRAWRAWRLQPAGLLAACACLLAAVATASAERSYTLFAEGAGIDETDEAWFSKKSWMKIREVNKTMNVVEWDYDILQDLPGTAQSKWNMMERVDGSYKPSSIKGNAAVCDDLHSKRPSIKALGYARSNLPKNCPIKQGFYSLRNHVPNENYFPVIIPGSQWRLSNVWSVDGKTIIKFHIDIKIDRTRKLQG